MSLPQPGDALADHRIPVVTPEGMKGMSVLAEDPNPIHLDRDAVKALGLGDRIINQGPINLGYMIDMIRANFPEGRVARFQARLLSNVFEGDDVTASGTVESVEPGDDGTRITTRVWLEVAGAGRAVEGTIDVVVP